MNLFFCWARLRNDLSVIDIFWSLGFWSMGVTAFVMHQQPTALQKFFLFMVSCWALRLSFYLGYRILKHGKEDQRYTNMRKNWKGAIWSTAYLKVYLLQFFLMVIISQPIYFYLSQTPDVPLQFNHFLGFLFFIYGFVFQVWGDTGLAIFKSNPLNKGKLYTQGAWKYSQHPNYFGEASMWVGFYLFSMMDNPWWTVLSPTLMIFLLLKVSGIPLLNRSQKYANDEEYQVYKERTSLFVPWF